MNGDPLSDVIALSGARCTATRCMELDGAFHFCFATPAGIKFVAVTHGFCWLAVEGMQPRALETGDVFMLRGGPATYLAKWRMSLAERELRATSRPISSIAHSIGFASASAFGAAFRSRFGVAPKLYRREAGSRTLDCGGRD